MIFFILFDDLSILFLISLFKENKKGIEKIRYHKATTIDVALIFSEFSFVSPNGKVSLSIKIFIQTIKINIPPIYPKANPKPEDFPKFLELEIFLKLNYKKLCLIHKKNSPDQRLLMYKTGIFLMVLKTIKMTLK